MREALNKEPSPVYRRENIDQKAEKYKKELPMFTYQELKDRLRERFGGTEAITLPSDYRK